MGKQKVYIETSVISYLAANAVIYKQLDKIISKNGYEMPVLCTPNELLMK